jgi:hypothetical protein
MSRYTFIIGCLLLLSGCASVQHDSHQVIRIRPMCGQAVVSAQCTAENNRGRWTFRAPSDVTVQKDFYALRVQCKSNLFDRQTTHTAPVVQKAMAGNLLIGGVVGAAVDVGSGRGFRYPNRIDVAFPACELY